MLQVRAHEAAGLLLGVAAALAVAPGARASEAKPGTVVQDLYYGEALFQFYQDDHFTALTHLLAARAEGRVSHHDAESELLLGGLYLSYGQHDRAEEIFTRLLADPANPAVHDRAWFYLGKVRYQRGLYAEALDDFARVTGSLPRDLAAEMPMLMAQSQMALGRFDAAAALLDGWKGPDDWLPYARYNLGVALVRLDRLADGARQLDRVGREPAATEELRDLRDKANLALGYAYLQKSLEGQARPVLERVRLNGPFSSKALLGVGWADVAGHRYQEALTPWLELKGRDILDSAVQESLLAVPYAYGELDAHGTAAREYEASLRTFDAEIARLDQVIGQAAGGLVPAVLRADDARLGRWYWQLDQVPDTVESRYLYLLMANNDFQEGLRNVRDLRALEAQLDEWQQKVATFGDIVEARRIAYARREPGFSSGLGTVDLERARARRDALAARLAAAAAGDDPSALADETQLDQWRRLSAIEADAGFAGADDDTRDRERLLKGVLLWDLDRDQRYRLYQQRQSLRELDTLLARAGASQSSAQGARRGSPGEIRDYAARIAAVTPRIATMKASVARARGRQEAHLEALAIDALKEQKQRLAAYRVQAQFALATIYDRAAAARAAGASAPATPGKATSSTVPSPAPGPATARAVP